MSTPVLIAWAVAAGLLWLAWTAFECFVWPYTTCRRCKGNGRFRSPVGRAWRNCRKCRGSGTRVRLGRRLWTKAGIAKKKMVG